jgi:hypothetical protein
MPPGGLINRSAIQTGRLLKGKRETAKKIIAASNIQQACRPQVGGTKAVLPKIGTQTSRGSVADPQAFDHVRGVYATLPQIDQRVG